MLSGISYIRSLKYFLETTLFDSGFDLVEVLKIMFSLYDCFEYIFFVNFIANRIVSNDSFQINY